MRITNRYSLPDPIFRAVKNDPYDKGKADISVTELISPPRQVALKRQHWKDLEEDCSDRIWSLCGQVMHTILERANANDIAEQRLSIKVEGWTVSGGMDLYSNWGVLSEYKFTSAWKFKGGQILKEHEEQCNCYAEILRANGYWVKKLQIVAILRDWSKLEARRDRTYPQSQTIVLPVPLWPRDVAQKFLRERVILHKQARITLPPCTEGERWTKPTVFAVMKKLQLRAVRLYASRAEAEAHISGQKYHYIVERPGQDVRCENYCPVKSVCTQFNKVNSGKFRRIA